MRPTILVISAVFALTLPVAAFAADAAQTPAAEAAVPVPAAQSDQDLASLSGGQGPVAVAMTEQDLTAINTGNQINANSVGSGSISLQGSAFSDFSGVGNFTMNTGHNNNLQSSMSVTIIVTH